MYGKLGKIKAAHSLFDEMPERNEASWNTMISALVRVGSYRDAIGLFRDELDLGIEVTGHVLASALTACSRSGDMFCEGLQLHGIVQQNGLLHDVFVGTALLHFYGQYGFSFSAQRLFEEMPEQNIVSWTSLMLGYSDNGNCMEVLDIYQQMRRCGLDCNQNTFSLVISSCGSLEDGNLGHQVLSHVIKSGYESNVSVGNAIVSMFGNFGRTKEASCVFDRMIERDTISWNSMISVYARNWMCEESLRCFYLMRCVHNDLDVTTLSTLLTVCSSVDSLKWGRGIHDLVLKLGLDSNICVCNTLLTMYSEAGRYKETEELFRGMAERDLISWNSMMAAYVQEGKCLSALKVLAQMRQIGISTNFVSFASALAACSNHEFLPEGKIVHGLALAAGLRDNVIVGNAIVTMYGKCGLTWEAEQEFCNMPEKDLVTWNALIGGYAENDKTDQAVKYFRLMRESGEPANYITMVNVLGACSVPIDLLKHGMPLHAHIFITALESYDYVKNSLVTMYAKCGDPNSSNYIFDGLIHKNTVTWNAIIAANAHYGHGEKALNLFVGMRRARVDLDQFSFSAALAAAANLAILGEGQQLHSLVITVGFDSYLYVRNITMDMYGKCGEIKEVLKILPEPNLRSQLSWNILISAFARHGSIKEATETFHEMLKLGLKPDHVTFVSLLSACSHGGLVDEGLHYFASMTSEFGVPVAIEHCVCMIDLLGRSGKLSEAEAFIKEMPVPPNGFVWRTLLAACRTHGNLELGKKAIENLLQSNPSDDSGFVLYSNVCATAGRWEDVQNVRDEMETNNVRKKPACSWVKFKREVSTFGIGDQSHPQSELIYAKLGEIMEKIKEAGYVPDTSFALHDTDEEQKEHNLWKHSERLALAYGLISTPEGSTLRVFKNLRVCGDCHSVYKFVSGIVSREVILRDPYRFHCFSGGKCSCGDYW